MCISNNNIIIWHHFPLIFENKIKITELKAEHWEKEKEFRQKITQMQKDHSERLESLQVWNLVVSYGTYIVLETNSNKGFSYDNHKSSHWLPILFCLHLKQRFVGASCLNLWNFLYLIDSPRCSLKSLFCVFTLIITCMKWWIYEFRINFRFLGNCPPTPPLTQHFAPSETQMLTLS